MHEMMVASEVLRAAGAELERHGCRRVLRLRLRVGERSGVSAENLRFCLQTASLGTPLEGAEISVESEPFRVRCRACGEERERGALDSWQCPACASRDLEVAGGTDLEVASMEAE